MYTGCTISVQFLHTRRALRYKRPSSNRLARKSLCYKGLSLLVVRLCAEIGYRINQILLVLCIFCTFESGGCGSLTGTMNRKR